MPPAVASPPALKFSLLWNEARDRKRTVSWATNVAQQSHVIAASDQSVNQPLPDEDDEEADDDLLDKTLDENNQVSDWALLGGGEKNGRHMMIDLSLLAEPNWSTIREVLTDKMAALWYAMRPDVVQRHMWEGEFGRVVYDGVLLQVIQQYLNIIEDLKNKLIEEKKKNFLQEAQIREEVCNEYGKLYREMEQHYK